MSTMRIGGAAVNQTPIDWDNNVKNILQAIQEAKNANVEILCLPELCITGYGCEDLFLTDWVCEAAIEQCFKIAAACTDIVVSVGLPIRLHTIVRV
jgi:NAD+ synthase (glutamine-hydrolysing)